MTHDEVVAEIQRRAGERGLLSHYCGDSRHCRGDRGFPDLVVAGLYGTAFLEVKTGFKGFSPAQTTWTYQLLSGGETALMVRNEDLADGTLNAIFDKIQQG